jgi:hypothetical protein
MKLKNYVLFDKFFLETCFSLHKQDVPIRVSFPLKKLLEVFEKEEKVVTLSRDGLYKKYGNPVYKTVDEKEELEGYKISIDNQTIFQNEINDLINMEFEIPIENKIEIQVNDPKFENLNLSSEKILTLEKIFEFKM